MVYFAMPPIWRRSVSGGPFFVIIRLEANGLSVSFPPQCPVNVLFARGDRPIMMHKGQDNIGIERTCMGLVLP
jgi:hypothetical protein